MVEFKRAADQRAASELSAMKAEVEGAREAAAGAVGREREVGEVRDWGWGRVVGELREGPYRH